MATRKINKSDIAEQRKILNSVIRERQITCEHKTNSGPTLKSVHEPDVMVKGKNNMGDKYFICEECNDIVNFETFDEITIDSAMHVLYGMCNQAKVLGDLEGAEYESICNIIRALDNINEVLKPFYLKSLLGELKKRDKGRNNNRNNNRSKGKINIGGSFNR